MSDEKPTNDDEPLVIRTREGLEVRINPDGSVTFGDLPPDLVEVALALDPEAVLACDPADDDD